MDTSTCTMFTCCPLQKIKAGKCIARELNIIDIDCLIDNHLKHLSLAECFQSSLLS